MLNALMTFGALSAATSVVLGAFGAHALQDTLNETRLKSFETAVRYQMYHVIVLLFVITYNQFTQQTKNVISYLFFAGIFFFSGSIYAITLGVSSKLIWFLTPLGGMFFIVGWLKIGFSFLKK